MCNADDRTAGGARAPTPCFIQVLVLIGAGQNPLGVFTTSYPHPALLYPASTSGCGRGLLLQHRLPLPQSLADGKAGDHAVDLGSPLAHVVLNVEDKRLLAEVGVYDFTWSLKPHSGVQIWLENTGLGGLDPTVRGVTDDGGGLPTTLV